MENKKIRWNMARVKELYDLIREKYDDYRSPGGLVPSSKSTIFKDKLARHRSINQIFLKSGYARCNAGIKSTLLNNSEANLNISSSIKSGVTKVEHISYKDIYRVMFKAPVEDMPLYLNDPFLSTIAKYRIGHGF